MLFPIKVVDIDLSQPLEDVKSLAGYKYVKALVRLHGVPIGYIDAPVINDRCPAHVLSRILLEKHEWKIICQLIRNGLAASQITFGMTLDDLFNISPPVYDGSFPLVTVAVCTRDSTSELPLCLDALTQIDYPALDILIIDNAPSNKATEDLVSKKYPNFRYVVEPRPGLDWARNRAIIESQGEIIAFTDDDVVVDSGWINAIVGIYEDNPEVMAVTGLTVPYELETESQNIFETYDGGFGKGFERQWYRVGKGEKMHWGLLGTGRFGTGANMAFRRCVFDEIGGFDPALDVGTITNGSGDLEMFFRILKEGYTLVYEPNAIVRHRHRLDYAKLQTQISGFGSIYSYFVCGARSYPDLRFSFLYLALWVWRRNIGRLLKSMLHPTRIPKDLRIIELRGSLRGLFRYRKSRKHAAKIKLQYGPHTIRTKKSKKLLTPESDTEFRDGIALRSVELTKTIAPLTDVTAYSYVRVYATFKGSPIGSFDIANKNQIVSRTRLIDAIVEHFHLKLLDPDSNLTRDYRWGHAITALNRYFSKVYGDLNSSSFEKLPANIPVSVVVGTYDRPDDLRFLLKCLMAQNSPRKIEIIVADNHPDSGITPPVVAEFPGVKLVSEPRQGVAYARNAGIITSTGDIVVTTDDDVAMDSDWLEKIIAPFCRADVACVSGNVLPFELETNSQFLFEKYGDGGLGRGFKRWEANTDWFEYFSLYAVPTWLLGGTANAAFRATIFCDPAIGLMDEALGPGMPSGVGEDIYIFYKILKAGYTIVYEPAGCVWHKHRKDMTALRRQLFNYSKGLVSYQLTTLFKDRDLRAIMNFLIGIPQFHFQRIKGRLLHRNNYPLRLVILEMLGHMVGPWAYWRSRRRVKLNGCSQPYVLVYSRTTVKNLLAEEKSDLSN